MSVTVQQRAAWHRALGDEHRLAIVDAVRLGDHTPGELARRTGLGTNLVAFHLARLEAAGVVTRAASEGDARRRYVRLAPDLPTTVLGPAPDAPPPARHVVFVCSRNASRSQLAAALWRSAADGASASSAGRDPAAALDPVTVTVARERGLRLTDAPRGYEQLTSEPAPDLLISVCDRAGEEDLPLPAVPRLHWSVPDPVDRGRAAVVAAYDDLAGRIARLLDATEVVA